MTTTFRACYFVTADGQGDICLTREDQAHLSDVELIEAAMAEARAHGLVGSTARTEYGWETMQDDEIVTTEQDVRDGLHISEYRR